MALKSKTFKPKTTEELHAEAVAAGVIKLPISTNRDAAFYFEEASLLAEQLGWDAKDQHAAINRVNVNDAKNKLCSALFSIHLAVRFPHIEMPVASDVAKDLMLYAEVSKEQFENSDFSSCQLDEDSLKLLAEHFEGAQEREKKQMELEG
jgi:hypothetical protein